MLKSGLLKKLREEKPLVHCITNMVVANFQANGLLAIGASPLMADALEETPEMAAASSSLVLNIGTLHASTVESMLAAGKSANQAGIPVVLDPVGAGATAFRKSVVKQLLNELDITLIRCNAGELAAIAGAEWRARGVDAGEGDMNIGETAKKAAKKYGSIVAVTGEKDYVSDGKTVVAIQNGHPFMPSVTGSGCLLSGVAGAFLGVANGDSFVAAITSLSIYGAAGELAGAASEGPGDFAVNLLNALHHITVDEALLRAKIYEEVLS